MYPAHFIESGKIYLYAPSSCFLGEIWVLSDLDSLLSKESVCSVIFPKFLLNNLQIGKSSSRTIFRKLLQYINFAYFLVGML